MKPDEQARTARLRRRNLLAALGLLSLLALSAASVESYRDLSVGRDRELDLRRQIADSERRIEALEQRVARLRDDPAAMEELAREELMMARPGEIVIVLPEEPAAEEASAPPPEVPAAAGTGGVGEG